MKTKKPDIFLGITMGMLVLAAVLCLVILFVQKSSGKEPKPYVPGNAQTTDAALESKTPVESDVPVDTGSTPEDTNAILPENLEAIDAAGLKAKLDDSVSGLTSQWQVTVIDPIKDTTVNSARNCKVDELMSVNRLIRLYVMGAAFQQVADGKLAEADMINDVTAMIAANDSAAGDRLVELLGGGSADKGREEVKAFATAQGIKIGFNRPLSGSSGKKNYTDSASCAKLLESICKGELVSKQASDKMLEILLTPVDSPEIATGLTGDEVRCGFIYDVQSATCACAVGVVRLPNRSYVVSIVSNEINTLDGAKKKVTDLISITQPFFEGTKE